MIALILTADKPTTDSTYQPLSDLRTLKPLHVKTLRSSARFTESGAKQDGLYSRRTPRRYRHHGTPCRSCRSSLKGLTGSGGRKQALSQVIGALEIARNTAINNGTNAAVIFPDSTSDSTFGGAQNPYRYRSMAVVTWNPTNTNSPPTMLGSWIVLPQGVAFFPTR